MKRLLVGSIFRDDSPKPCQWLDLQLNFLRASTEDFDHIAFLPAGPTNDYFARRTQIASPGFTDENTGMGSFDHLRGLNGLLAIFREKREKYQNFLFLDSDAFPINREWQAILAQTDIAVALRNENMETRLHASVLYTSERYLDDLSFEVRTVGRDLLGKPEQDVCIPKFQTELRDRVLPLVRSNKLNVHPLACGIYGDMFYHHGAGTMGDKFWTERNDWYWSRYYQEHPSFDEMLFGNPRFVADLAGWNPTLYVINPLGCKAPNHDICGMLYTPQSNSLPQLPK